MLSNCVVACEKVHLSFFTSRFRFITVKYLINYSLFSTAFCSIIHPPFMRASCPLLTKERTLPDPESVRSFCLYGYQSSHLRIICHMYQSIFFFLFASFLESWFKIRLSRRLVYGGTSKVLSAESWKLHNHSSDTFFWTRAGRTVRRDHLPYWVRSEEARDGWSKGAEREMLPPMSGCHRQGDEGPDRTMILLYGAGGGPGRGGRPMDSIRSRASDDFPLRV